MGVDRAEKMPCHLLVCFPICGMRWEGHWLFLRLLSDGNDHGDRFSVWIPNLFLTARNLVCLASQICFRSLCGQAVIKHTYAKRRSFLVLNS